MGYYLKNPMPAPAESRSVGCPSLRAKTRIGAPFGNPILSTKYWDSDTKTIAYQLRDYGSGISRWMSRDPIDEMAFRTVFYTRSYLSRPGSLAGNVSPNLFSFLNNEPVSWFDSDGAIPLQLDRFSITTDSGKKEFPRKRAEQLFFL